MTVKHASDVEAKDVLNAKDTKIQVLISSKEGPNFALRKFSMQKGGGMPRHTNTVEHEQYVLRGKPPSPSAMRRIMSKPVTWFSSPKVRFIRI
ncbi:MAG: hypothetical protein M1282_06130 [Chloroflexi bacterium]|nr:hypothetical protein [Chloroflexota bacterium]